MNFDLATLKSKGVPHATFADVFKVVEGETADPAVVAELDKYLGHFAPGNDCLGCGKPLAGDILRQFAGLATFTWGLAHGEGHCRECGYPARAFHRNVGPVEFFKAVLQYHPDELKERESEAA